MTRFSSTSAAASEAEAELFSALASGALLDLRGGASASALAALGPGTFGRSTRFLEPVVAVWEKLRFGGGGAGFSPGAALFPPGASALGFAPEADSPVAASALLDGALLDEALLDEALLDEALLDGALLDEALLDEALLDETLLDEALLTLLGLAFAVALAGSPRGGGGGTLGRPGDGTTGGAPGFGICTRCLAPEAEG